MAKKNWDRIKNQSATDTLKNRDVYESQQLDRSKVGKKQSFTSRRIIAICVGILAAFFLWIIWSMIDVNTLDKQSEADANVATVITSQAPEEPRELSDVTWANMLLVEDSTYANYGYTYKDLRTDAKYTQTEYDIWLDVHRRIASGACPELIEHINDDGTYTYTERPAKLEAPTSPRKFTDAEWANMAINDVYEDSLYADLGYDYYSTYNGEYLTSEEYEKLQEYTHERIQSLINSKKIDFSIEQAQNNNGSYYEYYVFYDIDSNAVVPNVPTEEAGERYTVPIQLGDLTWANMWLVEDSTAASLGYTHRDERTGNYYTLVEHDHWVTVYNNVINGIGDKTYWREIDESGNYYTFSEYPAEYASSEPRDFFKEYLEPDLMKMNMIQSDVFADYGYFYVEPYTLMFYSEAEYQVWLDVQNRLESGDLFIPEDTQAEIKKNNINVTDIVLSRLDPEPVKHTFADGFAHVSVIKVFATIGTGVMVYALLAMILKRNLDAQNLMNDTSDINQYENDQHIALPEEVQRKFDWFPDVGAHCTVQVSSMISHMMITNKGLNKIKVAKRAEKDIVDEDGDIVYYKGEILRDEKGEPMTEMLPLIDNKFADELYEASGAPKEVRKYYDATKIPYNPDGKDRTKQMGTHKTVADAINKTWTYPLYEPQRPAGAYIVDTEPVNTMVLAITRAGKGNV